MNYMNSHFICIRPGAVALIFICLFISPGLHHTLVCNFGISPVKLIFHLGDRRAFEKNLLKFMSCGMKLAVPYCTEHFWR